MKYNKLNTYN